MVILQSIFPRYSLPPFPAHAYTLTRSYCVCCVRRFVAYTVRSHDGRVILRMFHIQFVSVARSDTVDAMLRWRFLPFFKQCGV